MIKTTAALVLGGALLVAGGAVQGSDIDHHKGLEANTLEEAVANFSEYNHKLAAIVEQDELSAQDLDKVHELTYTLENALEKIEDELSVIAELLEEVHVGSETLKYDEVRDTGRVYLEKARELIE